MSSSLTPFFFSYHSSNPSTNLVGSTYKTHPESNYFSTSCDCLCPIIFSQIVVRASKLASLIHPLLPGGTFSHNNQSNSITKCRSDHVTLVLKIFQVASHHIHLQNVKPSPWSVTWPCSPSPGHRAPVRWVTLQLVEHTRHAPTPGPRY